MAEWQDDYLTHCAAEWTEIRNSSQHKGAYERVRALVEAMSSPLSSARPDYAMWLDACLPTGDMQQLQCFQKLRQRLDPADAEAGKQGGGNGVIAGKRGGVRDGGELRLFGLADLEGDDRFFQFTRTEGQSLQGFEAVERQTGQQQRVQWARTLAASASM